MKILIWILTFFIGTVLNALLGELTGIKAGAVVLYLGEYFIAGKLCDAWDRHKFAKEDIADEKTVNADIPAEQSNDVQTVHSGVIFCENTKICFCRHCGFKLIDGSDFCSNCGTRIETESDG